MTDYSRYALYGDYGGEEHLVCLRCFEENPHTGDVSFEDVKHLARAIELADKHEASCHAD